MTVTPTTNTEAMATQNQLWAMSAILRCNWSERILVRSSFRTSVEHANSVSEHRWATRSRPLRLISLTLTSMDRKTTREIMSLAHRSSKARSLFPVYPDQRLLTASASATDTVINLVTTRARYAAGQRVVIIELGSGPSVDTFEVAEIQSLTDTSLTLTAGLTNSFTSGSVVIPLIEANLSLTSAGGAITDDKITWQVDALETVGATQLAVQQAGDTTPSGFAEHYSLPIFKGPVQWDGIQWRIDRVGSFSEVGIVNHVETYGARGRVGFDIPLFATTRAECWDLLKFFESRQGMARAFWVVSPITDYTLVGYAASNTKVVVEAVGPELDWSFRPYLALEELDGTITILEVDTVSRSAGQDTVTPVSGTLPTLANVRRACVAYKARMDSDEFVEEWITDQGMATTIKVRELLEEKDITIANLTEAAPTDLVTEWVPGYCPGVGPCDAAGRAIYKLESCSAPGVFKYVADVATTWSHGGTFDSWADLTVGMTVNLFNGTPSSGTCWEFLGLGTGIVSTVAVTVYGIYADCTYCAADEPPGGDEDGEPPAGDPLSCTTCTGAQPNAVVSGATGDCASLNGGGYDFSLGGFSDGETACFWEWFRSLDFGAPSALVSLSKTSGEMQVSVDSSDETYVKTYPSGSHPFTCVGGILTGTATGLESVGITCPGDTLDLSLG